MSSLAYQHMESERRRIRNLATAARIPERDRAAILELLSRDQIRRARAMLKKVVIGMEVNRT